MTDPGTYTLTDIGSVLDETGQAVGRIESESLGFFQAWAISRATFPEAVFLGRHLTQAAALAAIVGVDRWQR